MQVAGFRVRITIQKQETHTDEYANHVNAWSDYFRCWASVSQAKAGSEEEAAGHTVDDQRMDFTVRWCSETARVDAAHYRILLGEDIYNITTIDEQGFRRKSRKFICERKER